MLLEATLPFDKNQLEHFFKDQEKKYKLSFNSRIRNTFFTSAVLLIVSFILFWSMNEKNHFVPWNFLSGLAGIFYLFLGYYRFRRIKKISKQSYDSVEKFFMDNKNTDSVTLKVYDEKIDYFRNQEFDRTFDWSEMTNIIEDEDYYYLVFGDITNNIMSIRSLTPETFYNGLLELAKEKQGVTSGDKTMPQ